MQAARHNVFNFPRGILLSLYMSYFKEKCLVRIKKRHYEKYMSNYEFVKIADSSYILGYLQGSECCLTDV